MKNRRIATLTLALTLLWVGTSFAHVTISPSEITVGGTPKFTMRVPHEREGSTVRIEVDFPAEATVAYFETKSGWTIEHKVDADGKIIGAVWSGSSIGEHEYAAFSFLARNPREATTLEWTIRQIYADGSDSEWSAATRVRAAEQ